MCQTSGGPLKKMAPIAFSRVGARQKSVHAGRSMHSKGSDTLKHFTGCIPGIHRQLVRSHGFRPRSVDGSAAGCSYLLAVDIGFHGGNPGCSSCQLMISRGFETEDLMVFVSVAEI
jgi:hypothetical protein